MPEPQDGLLDAGAPEEADLLSDLGAVVAGERLELALRGLPAGVRVDDVLEDVMVVVGDLQEKLRPPEPVDADAGDGRLERLLEQTGRGWRLDKSDRTAQIDAVIALAMCVERAADKPVPVELVGWI